MEEKTALYDWHLKNGGKIVPFAGYLLPVQYAAGVVAEHLAVRTRAGLFDVSHMAEIRISGKDALVAVQHLVTTDCSSMADGRIRYTLLCNDSGGIVDDLVVCKMSDTEYLLVVNAANHKKDFDWIYTHASGAATVTDVSDRYVQIALQGPRSEAILSKLASSESIPVKYYTCIGNGKVGGIDCIVSRTGYTGEIGFELYCNPDAAVHLWEMLLDAGKDEGLIPCGLGSRDTLRLEAAMPLYGHEMTDSISPFEVGLGRSVQLDKADFIGKEALRNKTKPDRIRVGLNITGHGIARGGEQIFKDDRSIGVTTSGSWCPFLKRAVAMALVDIACSSVGTNLSVEIRGKTVTAEVTPLPFYSRKK